MTDPNDCRVWVWGISPLDNAVTMDWGKTIDEFVAYVERQTSIVYFHNLKFDGHFIVDWLLNHGYAHRSDSRRGTNAGEFRTLISGMNKWYSLTVHWKSGTITEFRDSLKKINMPVRSIADAFKLDMSKGDIDYHEFRPIGHEPTVDELDYLQRDVSIVATALKQVIDNGMTKLTVASDSLAEYKRIVGDKYFNRMFPILSDSMDAEIRRAYRGGFTYADERFMKRKVGSGIVLDVNSLYPSVMYNKMIPYGEPEFVDGKVEPTERRPLTIFSVTFVAKLKPNHIPCIQIKGSSIFGATDYLKVIDEPTTLMVSDVDWKLYNDHYDITVIAWGGGWRFHATQGLFKDYIDKWSKIKAESTGGQREIAKLHLNSLYGKLASNPNVTGKIPILENGRVRFITGPDETKPPVYTAAGVFITAYARELTIRAAQENYDVFAYADTDSLHLLTDTVPTNIDVHPSRMGAWKFEYAFAEAWYVRAKAYLERKANIENPCDPECSEDHRHVREYHVAWAGLPQREQEKLTFDYMTDGNVIHGKLQPRSVPGGVVLEDVPYTLKM